MLALFESIAKTASLLRVLHVSHHEADLLAKMLANVMDLEMGRLAFVGQSIFFIRGYVKSAAAKRRRRGPQREQAQQKATKQT